MDPVYVKELLGKITLQDDQQAFEEIFNSYSSWLYSVAFGIVRHKEVAEEIVEDVFFKLWQIRDRYPEIKNLESYLYVSIKNLSYDHTRKASKRQFIDLREEDLKKHFTGPEQAFLVNELKEQIEIAVEKLPERCRKIFDLVRIDQLSYKEAAKTLNIMPKTVENQLRIAMKKILDELHSYLSSSK